MNDVILILVIVVLIIVVMGSLVFAFTTRTQNQKNDVLREKEQKELEELKAKILNTPVLTEAQAIEKASKLAQIKITDAEKRALEIETRAQESLKTTRERIRDQEKIIEEREKQILERNRTLEQRYQSLEQKEKNTDDLKKQLEGAKDELGLKLQKIANLTKQEAENLLKQEVEKDLQDWTAKKIKESEEDIKFKEEETSKEILVNAMLSAATDYVAETTTTTVTIDDESLKSRIIGKQGRNIRIFQNLTGVEVLIDDEVPNQITISCFDPIRREVAAIAMSKLLHDGRIHPGTIEDTIENVKKDLLREIKKTGEYISYESGINNLPNEIIMLLGRFKYRFSYGQNLVKHTLEMVKIAEYLAKELGADVYVSKVACLLHDLGKVVAEEGKQHHHISGEIARKYFKDERIINAIEAHHFDIESKYVEAEIVRIADAISGARPGARRDNYEDYVKRIRALEDIANKHKGVKETFAIHAGREVRVVVRPEETSDEDVKVMAYKIAREIEDTQNYPGVIKVNVVREYRVTDEAK